MPALRVFAKQIMKKKKKTDCFPFYIRSSASESRNKKDVIYTETVYSITTRALITTNSECKCIILIGHFRVAPSLCFKAKWFGWKWFDILMQAKLIIEKKEFKLSLACLKSESFWNSEIACLWSILYAGWIVDSIFKTPAASDFNSFKYVPGLFHLKRIAK